MTVRLVTGGLGLTLLRVNAATLSSVVQGHRAASAATAARCTHFGTSP